MFLKTNPLKFIVTSRNRVQAINDDQKEANSSLKQDQSNKHDSMMKGTHNKYTHSVNLM